MPDSNFIFYENTVGGISPAFSDTYTIGKAVSLEKNEKILEFSVYAAWVTAKSKRMGRS